MRRALVMLAALVLVAGFATGCSKSDGGKNSSNSKTTAPVAKYSPKTLNIDMVAITSMIGEQAEVPAFAFLKKDFKAGGVLDGHEVFSWSPDAITVYKGDTVNLTIAGTGPDDHVFTLPDFNVTTPIPSYKTTPVTFVASKVGVFRYYCTVSEHMPYMQGFLTVLPDSQSTG